MTSCLDFSKLNVMTSYRDFSNYSATCNTLTSDIYTIQTHQKVLSNNKLEVLPRLKLSLLIRGMRLNLSEIMGTHLAPSVFHFFHL